jgi:hypothetical protein
MQFVRKISGFNVPTKADAAAFLTAVDEIEAASTRLLANLPGQIAIQELILEDELNG